MRHSVALLLLAAVGCGKGEPPDPLLVTHRDTGLTVGGLKGADWCARLMSDRPGDSQEAAISLGRLGPDGLYWSLRAFRDAKWEHTQVNALAFLNYEEAKKFPEVVKPLLDQALANPSPRVRGAATSVILYCELASMRPALQAAHERETDEQAKKSMAHVLGKIP